MATWYFSGKDQQLPPGARPSGGVAIVVAKSFPGIVTDIRPYTHRVMAIVLTGKGKYLALLVGYGPPAHNPPPPDHDAQLTEFYGTLSTALTDVRHTAAPVILGDFNARVQKSQPGEHSHVGPHTFDPNRDTFSTMGQTTADNRAAFIAWIKQEDLIIANTWKQKPPHQLCTFVEPGAAQTRGEPWTRGR